MGNIAPQPENLPIVNGANRQSGGLVPFSLMKINQDDSSLAHGMSEIATINLILLILSPHVFRRNGLVKFDSVSF